MVVLSTDLWRYRKSGVDAVPIPMRVPASSTAPSHIKKYMSWPLVQTGRAKSALGNHLAGLGRQRICTTAHGGRNWRPPPCKKLYAIPLQYFQKCPSLPRQYLQTTLRQVKNEKVYSGPYYS